MPVLRASAGDYTQSVRRNTDSLVTGKARAWTDHPIVPYGKGTGFQLATKVREVYFHQPIIGPVLGFLGNTGRRFPQVGL